MELLNGSQAGLEWARWKSGHVFNFQAPPIYKNTWQDGFATAAVWPSCLPSAALPLTSGATGSFPLQLDSSYLLSGCCGDTWPWGVWREAGSHFLKREPAEMKEKKREGKISLLCREKVKQRVGSSEAFRLTTAALQLGCLRAPRCINAPFLMEMSDLWQVQKWKGGKGKKDPADRCGLNSERSFPPNKHFNTKTLSKFQTLPFSWFVGKSVYFKRERKFIILVII